MIPKETSLLDTDSDQGMTSGCHAIGMSFDNNSVRRVVMAHPAFLSIGQITCITTEDSTGSDDLFGILGSDKFSIGSFDDGTSKNVGINRTIASGVTKLKIMEADLLDSDDTLITIDLTQQMDTDRVVAILAGRARYNVSLKVNSESD